MQRKQFYFQRFVIVGFVREREVQLNQRGNDERVEFSIWLDNNLIYAVDTINYVRILHPQSQQNGCCQKQ